MKKYCTECGKQTALDSKFCSYCGKATGLGQKQQEKPTVPPAQSLKAAVNNNDDDDGDEEDDFKGSITATQLDVEILETRRFSETLGNLASQGQQALPMVSKDDFASSDSVDEKAFLEEFKREAGPIKGERQIERPKKRK